VLFDRIREAVHALPSVHEAPAVAIVNQTLARKTLNGGDVLGRTITLATGGPVVTMQIVGVVADTLYWSLREEVPPTVYTPLAQFYMPAALLTSMALSVRAKTGVPASLTKSVTAAVGTVNGQLPLTFRPFADQVNASLAQDRFVAMLSTFFGALDAPARRAGPVRRDGVCGFETANGDRHPDGARRGAGWDHQASGIARREACRIGCAVGCRTEPVGVDVRRVAAVWARAARSNNADCGGNRTRDGRHAGRRIARVARLAG
jgi:hypothetical protein